MNDTPAPPLVGLIDPGGCSRRGEGPAPDPFVNVTGVRYTNVINVSQVNQLLSCGAQELFRRRCISGEEVPEQLLFWQGKDHELDFVVEPGRYLEVKRGPTSPLEFSWFEQSLRGARLTVVSDASWNARSISGTTFEEFLRVG